jgi:YaiO family outer membrane protein
MVSEIGLRTLARTLAAVLALVGPAALADDLADARALYSEGKKTQAIVLLQNRLLQKPGDNDARVVLGSFYAWNEHYDQAREVLKPAVDEGRGDAIRVLVNVELWSDHPDRAEALASRQLEKEPNAADLHLAKARALNGQRRYEDAWAEIGETLKIEPADKGGIALQHSLEEKLRRWEIDFSLTGDWFNETFTPWWEATLGVSRRFDFGVVTVRAYRARRFDSFDNFVEIESYPHIREGTYAFLNAGIPIRSPGEFYPRSRFAAEIFQNLGAGFDASLGWRGLFFATATHILTASLGKYLGSYYAFVRGYWVLPSDGSTSGSVHLNLRRFFSDDVSYVGLRYAHGVSLDPISTTGSFSTDNTDTLALDALIYLPRGFNVSAKASVSRQGRPNGRDDLLDWSLGAGVGYQF